MLKFGLLCMLLPLLAVLLIAWWAMSIVPPSSSTIVLGYLLMAMFATQGAMVIGIYYFGRSDKKDAAAAAPDKRPGL